MNLIHTAKAFTQHADTAPSAAALRENQVTLMTAARPALDAPRRHWPTASPQIMSLWDSRHNAQRTFTTSYMAAQRKMLWLADLPPDARWDAFEGECFHHRLAPTTAETYWTTWLSAQRILDLRPSTADY